MIINWDTVKIYIKPGYVDFRKQINGLSIIALNQMKKDIFSGAFFIFASRDRKKLKILYWDKNGFCLWLKRLEKDKFPWPDTKEDAIHLSFERFKMLLEGIDFFNTFKELKYSKIY